MERVSRRLVALFAANAAAVTVATCGYSARVPVGSAPQSQTAQTPPRGGVFEGQQTSPPVPPSEVQTGGGPTTVPGRGGGELARPTPQPVTPPAATRDNGATELAGSSNPASDRVALSAGADECHSERDCACGVDRSTGACAFGPLTRIDPNVQCPDFCMGITGMLRFACAQGRCVQQTPR